MPLLLMALVFAAGRAAHADEIVESAEKQGASAKPAAAAATPADNVPPQKAASASGSGTATFWWPLDSLPTLQSFGIDSWTDVFHFGSWRGALETRMNQRQLKLSAPNRADQKYTSSMTSESVAIKNERFSLIHPHLLSGNFGMRFSLQQNRQDTSNNSASQDGTLTDYDFDATLLEDKPYNATFAANRAQTTNTNSYGGINQLDSEIYRIMLRLREDSLLREKGILPWFSASLQAEEENRQETTSTAGQSFRRDDESKRFMLDARNGFETADLTFHAEHTDFVDHTYAPRSYGSDMASLGYNLDFGQNLNRHWASQVYYSKRNGRNDSLSHVSVDETLFVEHFTNLSSTYYYQYQEQTTSFGAATAQTFGTSLQHQLYANLTTNLGLSGKQQVYPGGRINSGTGQLSFGYSHGLPWQGLLSASLGGSTEITDVQEKSGSIGVADAPYVAPSLFGADAGFLLSDNFIIAESIQVVVIKGDLRVLATAGTDYEVVAEGSRTRILPQPFSVIIEPGNLLLVSYVFEFDPSIKYQTSSRSMGLGADWGWIGVFFSHDENEQKPLSGSESNFLMSSKRDIARLNLQGGEENLKASGDATFTRYNETNLRYEEIRFTQYLSYQPYENLMFALDANEYRINYEAPERQTTGLSASLSTQWLLGGGWYGTATLSRRELQDSRLPNDTFTKANMKLQRKWAKLNVSLGAGLGERVRGSVRSMNANFDVSVVRKF